MTPRSWRSELPDWALATTLRAIPGWHGDRDFEIALRLFGLSVGLATQFASFDITSNADTPPPAITCAGDPAIITIEHEDGFIGIRFEGGGACSGHPDLSDDDPNVMLSLDADWDGSGWDTHDGENWSRESLGGIAHRGHTPVSLQHVSSGTVLALTFTVDLTLVNDGSTVRMTVQDVTITPRPGRLRTRSD